MTLAPGTRIGSFDVLGSLGAGGMGEVYRARDAKLKRDVAIKSLPPRVASDPETLARFQREAEVLASLNHPNIAAIHELHEEHGSRFLIMELVEGETLTDRIQRGSLPLDDILPIAKQIADGLEAAHEKGIVHRDLKPANLKINPDGRVKILDFGLAKTYETVSAGSMSHSPTLINGPTAGGVIMGTAAYMSPEQARGRAVTRQTDIWAFGCVLYEMSVGETAFSGETVSDTIAKILKEDPDFSRVVAGLRPLVRRCLEKDSRKRYRDIGDVSLDLEHVRDGAAPSAETVITRRGLPLAVAVVIAAIVLAVVLVQQRRTNSTMTWTGTNVPAATVAMSPRVSPDGRLVAFLAMVDGITQVAVMQTNSSDWTLLTQDRSKGLAGRMSWSTDSTRIYFTRAAPAGDSAAILSVPAVGGEERLVLEKASLADVLPDGSLLILRTNPDRLDQLHRYWPDTGKLQEYPAMVDTFANSAGLRAFANGKEAVFWGKSREQSQVELEHRLYIIDLQTSALTRVVTPAAVVAGGGLSLSSDGEDILVVVYSGDVNSVVQIPRNGGPGRTLFSTTTSIWDISAAADGAIYADQILRPQEIIRVGGSGGSAEHLLTVVKFEEEPHRDMAIPLADGRIIVAGNRQLLVAKPGNEPTPFIQSKEETLAPMTTLGTGEVAFILGRGPSSKLAVVNVADGRIVRRLEKVQGAAVTSLAASPDGKTIYYTALGKIWAVPSGDGEPKMIRAGDGVAVEPHGKYLIVQLNEDRTRLIRVPLNGDPEQPLTFPGILGTFPLAPNAIREDGAILKPMITGWIWSAALLHPDTGKIDRLPIPNMLDVFYVGWTPDGRVLCSCKQLHSSIWRFRPESR